MVAKMEHSEAEMTAAVSVEYLVEYSAVTTADLRVGKKDESWVVVKVASMARLSVALRAFL